MVILTVKLPKPDRHTDLASEKNIVWVATIRIQCGLLGSKKDFQPHADGHVEYAKSRAHHQQHNCSSATDNMLSSMVVTNVFIPLVVGLGRIQCRLCITQYHLQGFTWSFVASQRYQDSTESAHVTLCVLTHHLSSHSLEVLRSLCPDPNHGSFPANLDSVSFQFRLALGRSHRCKGTGKLRLCLIHCAQRPPSHIKPQTASRLVELRCHLEKRRVAIQATSSSQHQERCSECPLLIRRRSEQAWRDGLGHVHRLFQMLDK